MSRKAKALRVPTVEFPASALEAIRQAVANYMRSEGCGCCADDDAHREHKAVLAKILGVPPYDDDSGYDFSQFQTDQKMVDGSRGKNATSPKEEES